MTAPDRAGAVLLVLQRLGLAAPSFAPLWPILAPAWAWIADRAAS